MSEADEITLLRRLAKMSVASLLLSGGEPLLHPYFNQRVQAARELGLNITLSTNGTLIDESIADKLSACVSYVGVSLDGPRDIHEKFRGTAGAFEASVKAIELLASRGCRAGLRVTLAAPVIERLDEVFGIADNLPLSRICFYHFIPSGRGMSDASLVPPDDARESAMKKIMEYAEARLEYPAEILSVGEASDSVRIYKYLESKSDLRLANASAFIASRRPSGAGILSARWDGAVFRNQFMWGERLGTWDEIESIARTAPEKIAPECASCAWLGRKICGGRIEGFGRDCVMRE